MFVKSLQPWGRGKQVGVVFTGLSQPDLVGARADAGPRTPAGRPPAAHQHARGCCTARSLLCVSGTWEGGTTGLWKETHGPGPADVCLIFFSSDSKYLTTKVECLVGRREVRPVPCSPRRLRSEAPVGAPALWVEAGKPADPCCARAWQRPVASLQMWEAGSAQHQAGGGSGRAFSWGGPAAAGPCSLRLPGSG